MLLHPLTNFEIRKYYQNESRFKGGYSGDSLTEILMSTPILEPIGLLCR